MKQFVISDEMNAALTALAQRKYPELNLSQWMLEEHYELGMGFCNLCDYKINLISTTSFFHAVLKYNHAIFHLKEYNLLAFL